MVQNNIKDLISKKTYKTALKTVIFTSLISTVSFFGVVYYLDLENKKEVAKNNDKQFVEKNKTISEKNKLIFEKYEIILQNIKNEVSYSFKNKQKIITDTFPKMTYSKEGIYYKENKEGSAVWYGKLKDVTNENKYQVQFTEYLDRYFKNAKEQNEKINNIVLMTKDNMVRQYPFVDNIFSKYSEYFQTKTSDIYKIADSKNNENKNIVWTELYKKDNKNYISVVTPFYDKKEMLGVIAIEFEKEKILSNVDKNTIIVSKNKNIIAKNASYINGNDQIIKDYFDKTLQKIQEVKINNQKYQMYTLQINKDLYQVSLKTQIGVKNESFINEKFIIYFAGVSVILLLISLVLVLMVKRNSTVISKKINGELDVIFKQIASIKILEEEIKIDDFEIKELQDLKNAFVSFVNNLTQQFEKIQQDLQTQNIKTKQYSQVISKSTQNVINPISQIKIIVDQLGKNKKLTKKELQSVSIIEEHIKNIENMLLDVKLHKDLQENIYQSINESFEINEYIKQIYKETMPLAKEKKLKYNLKIQNKTNKMYMDKFAAQKVISEIINNAIKFTETGSISLEVSETSENVKITVKDTGIGMDEKNVEKIFNDFEQEHKEIYKNYGGLGLGLSIVKKFEDLTNINVEVKTKKDLGTEFEIILVKEEL